jgi:hypothetical protein
MAIDYSAEIEAIKLAISTGATKISYDGKSIDYDSFEKLLARLNWLETQQNFGVSTRPSYAFATFDRGDDC